MISKTLREKIFESIGTASMCWDPRPTDHQFSTQEAEAVGEKLVFYVEAEMSDIQTKLKKAELENQHLKDQVKSLIKAYDLKDEETTIPEQV